MGYAPSVLDHDSYGYFSMVSVCQAPRIMAGNLPEIGMFVSQSCQEQFQLAISPARTASCNVSRCIC